MSAVRIPADVDRPDQILFGLTARQLAVCSPAVLILGLGWAAGHRLLPGPVLAAAALPVVAATVVLVFGRRDGLSAERFVLAAVAHHRRPTRRVAAPAGPIPAWWTSAAEPAPGPLDLAAEGISPDGVVELGSLGCSVLVEAGSVNFALRTAAEQEALVAGFARVLNALSGPAQIVVRAEPINVDAAIADLRSAAGGLGNPALAAAALDHARFLAELAGRSDVLARRILIVLRSPDRSAGEPLVRGADTLARSLTAVGIIARRLTEAEPARALAAASDPGAMPLPEGIAGADEIVSGPAW